MSERDVEAYLFKAEESLAGAVSECANGRYNNCANRAYYACFQAAMAALVREGIRLPAQARRWGHDYVQARFVDDLINRRRRYPATMRQTLFRGMELRTPPTTRLNGYQPFRRTADWLARENS